MNNLIINTGNSGTWFSVISLFSFILVNGVFILKGLRQKHALESLLLITAAGILFFLIGIYLFPLSGEDLKASLSHTATQQLGEKSIIGGLLGLIARMLTIWLLKERMSLIDNIATVFLIGLGLQNLGCLLAGCCYGNPSGLPWAVQYPVNSPLFVQQLQNGIIQPGDAFSAPVHPVQLYLLLACFFAAIVSRKLRHYWKAPLSSFTFSMILYTLARFTVEFFRDPVTNHGAATIFLGLKEIQWLLLLLGALFSFFIWLRERKQSLASSPDTVPAPGLGRLVCILAMLLLANWWMQPLFDFANKVVISLFLFLASMAIAWKGFRMFTLPKYRAVTAGCLFAACFLMSQSHIPQNKDEKVTYTEIGGGAEFGQFYNQVAKNIGQSTDCRGNPYYATSNFKTLKYNSALAGFSYAKMENRSAFKRTKYGVSLYFGADTEKGLDTVLRKSIPIIAAQPFVSFDGRWVGFGAGLHLGTFHYVNILTEGNSGNVGKMVFDVKTNYIYPSMSFRVGPYDILYMKACLADHFPSASPLMYSEISLGSGLGKTDGRNISFGYSTTGRFIAATYPLMDNYFASAFYGYTPKSSSDPIASRSLFSIGMHYRFNYKTVPKIRHPEPSPANP